MLRNKSKQALMADQIPLLSPSKNTSTNTISSLISPRFFNGILTKSLQDSETALISPKSILDTKNSSPSANPFNYVKTPSKHQTIISSCNSNKIETEAIGLALIDSLNQEKNTQNSSKPINRMALFGSNLKVQIPPAATTSPPVEVTKSPLDFGIKTRNLLGVSPETPTRVFSRQLSLKEMELSEDYTCVITHGPNPKTIHIFDDCIVENCICEDVKISDDKKSECGFESIDVSRSSSDSFESFCNSCKDRSVPFFLFTSSTQELDMKC